MPAQDRVLGDIADLECERFEHTGPIRSVVLELIDEIDKAPRDVPNDLLAEVPASRKQTIVHASPRRVVFIRGRKNCLSLT